MGRPGWHVPSGAASDGRRGVTVKHSAAEVWLIVPQAGESLVRKLKLYTDPALLLCDELGYLSLDQQTSNLFYQAISTRHSQRRSTVITTNTALQTSNETATGPATTEPSEEANSTQRDANGAPSRSPRIGRGFRRRSTRSTSGAPDRIT